jgi:hypothetical protein
MLFFGLNMKKSHMLCAIAPVLLVFSTDCVAGPEEIPWLLLDMKKSVTKIKKIGWEINLDGQISNINEKSRQQKQIGDKDKKY